jgi:hypothetical protein
MLPAIAALCMDKTAQVNPAFDSSLQVLDRTARSIATSMYPGNPAYAENMRLYLLGIAGAETNYGRFRRPGNAGGLMQTTNVFLNDYVRNDPRNSRIRDARERLRTSPLTQFDLGSLPGGADIGQAVRDSDTTSMAAAAVGAYEKLKGRDPGATREERAANWKKMYNTPKDNKGTESLYLRHGLPGYSSLRPRTGNGAVPA